MRVQSDFYVLGQTNILIGTEDEAILCDFGSSRIRHEVTRSQTAHQAGAHRRYAAPEHPKTLDPMVKIQSTESSDIYSLSMTLFHLQTLQPPFAHLNEDEAWLAARKHNGPLKSDWKYDDSTWEVLSRMWDRRPKRRPNALKVQDALRVVWKITSIQS